MTETAETLTTWLADDPPAERSGLWSLECLLGGHEVCSDWRPLRASIGLALCSCPCHDDPEPT